MKRTIIYICGIVIFFILTFITMFLLWIITNYIAYSGQQISVYVSSVISPISIFLSSLISIKFIYKKIGIQHKRKFYIIYSIPVISLGIIGSVFFPSLVNNVLRIKTFGYSALLLYNFIVVSIILSLLSYIIAYKLSIKSKV